MIKPGNLHRLRANEKWYSDESNRVCVGAVHPAGESTWLPIGTVVMIVGPYTDAAPTAWTVLHGGDLGWVYSEEIDKKALGPV